MIIVDTNVISELMRGEPHPAVLAWVAARPRRLLCTTHIGAVRITAADDDPMGLAGQAQIVGVAPLAAQQNRVLVARHRLADRKLAESQVVDRDIDDTVRSRPRMEWPPLTVQVPARPPA